MRHVGVDIGATAVRVVEIAGVDGEGFALVSRIGMSPVPPGAVIAGRIRSVKDVSVALRRALRNAGVPRHGFVLGVNTPDVALATLQFPVTVRVDEREGAIRAMNRPLGATFALEDSTIGTYLAGTSTLQDGTPTSTVGVASVLTSDIDALRAVCDMAKCAPRAIDLSGAALLRAMTRANPAAGEVGTVVDVGATKTTVATRQGLFLRSLRTTPGGGDDITRTLVTVTRSSVDDAEKFKLAMRLTAPVEDVPFVYGFDDNETVKRSPVDSAVSTVADALVDMIAQSIDADASTFGTMTQAVTLCGGTAMLRGFKDRLQSRLGVPTGIARPWIEIERSRRNAAFFKDGRPDPRLLLVLGPAVGLALWREPS